MTDQPTQTDKNKQVVDRIPQNIEELYRYRYQQPLGEGVVRNLTKFLTSVRRLSMTDSYPIDWPLLKQHDIIETRIRPWVVKKVVDYLGEEVPDFIDFVLRSVEKALSPRVRLDWACVLPNIRANLRFTACL